MSTKNNNSDCWALFDLAIKSVSRVYLWGPPGVGKSRAGLEKLRTLCRNDNQVWQISLNEDMVIQELLGHYVPSGKVFMWHDGPVAQAFRNGGYLVVNELARASGAVKDLFLAVLDDPAVANISLPTGERLAMGKNFKVVTTANMPPDDLDEALQDRFDTIIEVDIPHPGVIKYLNQKAKGLGDIVFDSYKDPKRALSPRRALALLELLSKRVPMEQASDLAFGARSKDVLALLKARKVLRGRVR